MTVLVQDLRCIQVKSFGLSALLKRLCRWTMFFALFSECISLLAWCSVHPFPLEDIGRPLERLQKG